MTRDEISLVFFEQIGKDMNKDRKIKILTDQIEYMRKRIEDLQNENKLLYEQINIQQDVEHENVKQTNDVLEDLYKKRDEYDDLIRRCKKTKKNYEELNREMVQMMSEYKKDMSEINTRKLFGGNKA